MTAEQQFESLADQYVEQLRVGTAPPIDEFAEQHPGLADRIRRLFPILQMMEQQGSDCSDYSESSLLAEEMKLLSQLPPLKKLGDYRLIRELGRGGMGVVYQAEQESLGRNVALKLLPDTVQFDQRRQQRFQQEARASAMLHHTNIVPIFGVGQSDHLSYLVMQFIDGRPLDQLLRELEASADRNPSQVADASDDHLTPPSQVADELLKLRASAVSQASLSTVVDRQETSPTHPSGSSRHDSHWGYWEWVARIGLQVAGALEHAHAKGILHRDIKPSNLLLDTEGTVWVTDFGLAKYLDSPNLTRTGEFVGTLRYMSPDQLAGDATEQSDLYSLGLTLFELATLRPAFRAPDRPTLLKQVSQGHVPTVRSTDPSVPRDLGTIIDKCLSAEPDGRYASASALSQDLECFLTGQPIAARRTGSVERLAKWCRRNPVVSALVLLLMVTGVAGVSGVIWQWRKTLAALDKAQAEEVKTSLALKTAEAEKQRAQKQSELALGTLTDVIHNYQMAFDSLNLEANRRSSLDDQARREMLNAALTSMEQVAERLKAHTDYSVSLLIAHMDLGDLYLTIGSEDYADARDEALGEYQQALMIGESLIEKEPDDLYLRRMHAQVMERMGRHAFFIGDNDAGRDWLLQAVNVLEDMWEKRPDSFVAPNTLLHLYLQLGTIEHRDYEIEKARGYYEKCLETIDLAAQRDVQILKDHVEQHEVLPLLEERLKIVRALPGVFQEPQRYLDYPPLEQAGLLYNCAAWSVRLGDHRKAAGFLHTIEQLETIETNQWYNAACGYAKCYLCLQTQEDAGQETSNLETYLQGTIRCLRKAEATGYFDAPEAVALMLRDVDLDVLRQIPEFQATAESIRDRTLATAEGTD